MPNTSDPQEIKKNQILDAAYERFSHYGYAKTTMNEIAGDLSMSKALLYYYFPDKSQLYAAVIRKLSAKYITELKAKIQHCTTLEEGFFFVLQKMHEVISTNYNFLDYIKLNQQNLPSPIQKTIEEIHHIEVKLITNLYYKQVSKEFVATHNLQEIIELIFKALDGVNHYFYKNKLGFFPDVTELKTIYTQKKLLLKILIKGLKAL